MLLLCFALQAAAVADIARPSTILILSVNARLSPLLGEPRSVSFKKPDPSSSTAEAVTIEVQEVARTCIANADGYFSEQNL